MSATEIRVGDNVVTLVNIFDVEAAKQQELIDLLNEGTEKVVKNRPGFISVNIIASLDGTRVLNYAQWRSQEDVQATMADPEMRAFGQKAAALATASPQVYRVASVHHA